MVNLQLPKDVLVVKVVLRVLSQDVLAVMVVLQLSRDMLLVMVVLHYSCLRMC